MEEKKFVDAKDAPQAIGPYSQGVQAGRFLFLSGQIGFHPETMAMVSDDVEEQTRQTLENIKAVLAAAGAGLQDLVKVNIYIVSLDDFPVINKVYKEYFTEGHPARATVQVAGLAAGAKLEVDGIAYLP